MDETTKNIIKSTVPILQQHGEEITKCFYKNLFSKNPELLNIFNITNQSRGRQPRALANSILAAASHIDDLSAILPVVNLIAHKHVALGVKKEHYPIVGENLLIAIRETLGVGDDVINAWGAYYGQIAQVFINYEENLYQTMENSKGGWRGLKEFVVQRKNFESENIASFYLVPKEGGEIPNYLPGQYVTLTNTLPRQEFKFNRHYSISDVQPDHIRITVKRLLGSPNGLYSNHIHDNVKEGDVLHISPPAGEFVLRNPNKLNIFLAGGIGITPILSMIKSIKDNMNVKLCFSVKSSREYPFVEEINQLKSNEGFSYHLISNDPSTEPNYIGRLNKEWIVDNILDMDADYYVSGPDDYNKDIVISLKELGVPPSQIYYEFFGPKIEL